MGEFSLWGSRTSGYCHGSINGADLSGLFVPFRCSGLFSRFGLSGRFRQTVDFVYVGSFGLSRSFS